MGHILNAVKGIIVSIFPVKNEITLKEFILWNKKYVFILDKPRISNLMNKI